MMTQDATKNVGQATPRFAVGAAVSMVNGYGRAFHGFTVTAIEQSRGEFRYYLTPTDNPPWYSIPERNVRPARR